MITKFVDLRPKMYSFLFDGDGGRKNFNKTKVEKNLLQEVIQCINNISVLKRNKNEAKNELKNQQKSE